MRIISGIYGGRVLNQKVPDGIRPTTDKVREALFNILTNLKSIEDTEVLDIFAGTGALGIEALSRGASFATFVDISFKSLNLLKSNLNLLNIPNEQTEIIKSDVAKYLGKTPKKFDIIFADPPYKENIIYETLELIDRYDILQKNGIIIFETDSKIQSIANKNYEKIKEKIFGITKISYFSKKND
jgi:16S rRNA (guanine(966)-N(2))-methyltransferase RsmD